MTGILTLTGCAVALVGAAVTTVDIATDRRDIGDYVGDNEMEFKIRTKIQTDAKLRKGTHVSITVMNGVALLTGEVFSKQQRSRIVQLVKKEDPREIIDRIKISGTTSLVSRTNDAWITGKVKTVLYTNLKLSANRIKVVTELGEVYLLGLVTKKEAEAAVNSTRIIKGVTKVYKVFQYIQA